MVEPGRGRPDCVPHAELGVHARIEVLRMGLDAWQRAGQQAQAPERQGLRCRISIRAAIGLNGMVDRANSRAEQQPLRRWKRYRGIKHDCPGDEEAVVEAKFGAGCRVGYAST